MSRELEPPPPVPARRFTDVGERPTTVIGPGIRLRGELTGDDPVDVAGTLEGDSQVTAHYTIRASGRVVGKVEAAGILVAGEVSGPLLSAEKVEIGAGAKVRADIHARVVAIAEGALFEGQVRMQGKDAGAPISFKERRNPGSSEAR